MVHIYVRVAPLTTYSFSRSFIRLYLFISLYFSALYCICQIIVLVKRDDSFRYFFSPPSTIFMRLFPLKYCGCNRFSTKFDCNRHQKKIYNTKVSRRRRKWWQRWREKKNNRHTQPFATHSLFTFNIELKLVCMLIHRNKMMIDGAGEMRHNGNVYCTSSFHTGCFYGAW